LQSQTGKKFPHAALFNDETNGADLGALGGDMSIGIDINQNGQIVGWAENSLINNRAFLYDHGVMHDLGTLGGASSDALAINNHGEVVGYSQVTSQAGSQHAFIYAIHTSSAFFFGASTSEARDINDSNQVVGSTYKCPSAGPCSRQYGVAFLYDEGFVTALPTLGGESSYAYAINNHSQVVGHSYLASGAFHAFVYDNGNMTDLNSVIDPAFGWELLFAQDINNNGQIVGYGTIGGQGHAFLLTPIPEPSAGLLAVLAMCGLSARPARRFSRAIARNLVTRQTLQIL
jgi:probable HAF family extracellular repeat protein